MIWLFLAASIYPETSLLIKVQQSKEVEDFAVASGVLIASNKVLTAAHVVVNDNQIVSNDKVYIYCDKKIFKVKIDKVDNKKDLALLTLYGKCNQRPVLMAKKNPEFTDFVLSVTNPDGIVGLASSGIVSGYKQFDNETWLYSNIQTYFGSSGGPLFNYKNELVGILSRIRNFTTVNDCTKENGDVVTASFSMWVPIATIREFLKK